jgi:hypothetical protein
MRLRSQIFVLLFLLAIFIAVRFDVPTKVKFGATNLIYGDEMRSFRGFRLFVESLIPELEKEGLTREMILRELTTKLEKAGIKSLGQAEWQKTPGKPALNVLVNATKTGDGRYQYSVTIEVGKSELLSSGAYSEKIKAIWTSSGMGEGDVADIRATINEEAGFFLKSHSSS